MSEKDSVLNVKELLGNNIEEVYFSQWVTKLNRRNRSDKRFIIVSDSGFKMFNLNKLNKNVQVSKSFSLFDLKSIGLSQLHVQYCFTRDESLVYVTVISQNANELLNAIGKLIVNLLYPEQYPEINVPGFDLSNFKPSYFRGITRLIGALFCNNELSQSMIMLVKTYKSFLLSGNNKLNFGIFNDTPYLNYIVDTLNFVPHVDSVVFPFLSTKKRHWELFQYLILKSTFIRHIETNEILTSSVHQLNYIIPENYHGKIKSLTIGSPNFSISPSIFLRICETCKIPCLKISNSIHSKSLSNSLSTLLKGVVQSQNIKSFILNNMKRINSVKVIKYLSKVKNLGLTYCDIELSKFMEEFCLLPDIEIESIDLSGNIFSNVMRDTHLDLPSNLKAINFSSVDFFGISFNSLFSFLISQKREEENGISINLSNLKLDDDQWDKFFDYISKHINSDIYHYPFREIIWDNNEIKLPLFQFFEKNTFIKTLSLNGCLGSNSEIIERLIIFMKNNKTCQELRIAGSLKNSLPAVDLEKIISSLNGNNGVLKKLIISHHEYRNKTLDILAQTLFSNTSIKYVDFTYNSITQPMEWQMFLSQLNIRGVPLEFPFPLNEIGQMLEDCLINNDELTRFFDIMANIHHGNRPNTINPTNTMLNTNDEHQTQPREEPIFKPDPNEWEINVQIPNVNYQEIDEETEKRFQKDLNFNILLQNFR